MNTEVLKAVNGKFGDMDIQTRERAISSYHVMLSRYNNILQNIDKIDKNASTEEIKQAEQNMNYIRKTIGYLLED